MEENSKVSMEADVSSTTGDALEAENVTETFGNLETIIVVENVSEESLNSSIKLFTGPEPCESSVEVPLSTSLQGNDQDNCLKGKPESNMLSQKSVSSPSKDISKNNDETKSHHQQKTYNNKHKSLGKHEQLQVLSCKEKSPVKTDNHQNTCNVQDRCPLKSDARQKTLITKDKTPLKIVQVHKISIEKLKSQYKPDQSQITSNGKDTSLLKTDQPQKILKEKHSSPSKPDQPQKILNDETTPAKTIEMEDSDKDKALNTDQSLKIYNVKHNSLSISNQPDLMFIESSQDTNDSTNVLNSENLGEKPTVTPMEVSTNASPENNLPADQKKSSSNESADKTMDNKMDKEEEMSESISIIDNCEKEDSQSEINSEIEKDHNKNISRELKSLIKSAKESKIISECNQVTSKTRKSRSALDTSFTSAVESDKIQDIRRSSINSQKSNSSEKSEKTPKRSMRSQNPEFVNKVKQFLNSVTGKFQKGDSDDEMDVKKETQVETVYSPSKKKKHVPVDVDSSENTNKLRTDPYCWRCHWAVEQGANEKGHPPMQCTICPRAIHFKCLTSNERNKITADKSWVCPECLGVLHAESSETRSPAMKKVSLGLLCELLHYALERMKNLNGVEPFLQPVDRTSFPDYDKYVVHPMDLSLMKDNITEGLYGSTEAFLADVQWILHNSIIFNTLQSKLTGAARALVRSCRAEMGEIEACPECYSAAHARRPTWFTDVCSTPHMLLWAKLKGFPYWPAKGMSVSSTGMVDVRFFGAHDRAWVPARDCYLYCERDPNNFRSKRQDILDSMQEAEQHIRNISRKYGQFVYPPFKTPFDPTKLMEQLKIMIPTFDGDVGDAVAKTSPSPPTPLGNSRTASKSSKTSLNDGEVSESEDAVSSRKMADGADAHRDQDLSLNKNKSTDVISKVENVEKEKEVSRKRRRSDLEEAVITIMDTREKRRKIEADVIKTEITKKVNEEKENVSEINKTLEVNEKDQDTSGGKVVPTSSKMDTDPTIAAPKVKPIKISISRDNDKAVPIIMKPDKKDVEKDKIGEKNKSEKRRNSRNKSINTPNGGRTEKKDTIVNVIIKEKKDREKAGDPKSKDRLNIDDNTSLAVIAREGAKSGVTCLPTISCVRSLSTAQNSHTSTNSSKLVEVTVSNSNIFIPTGTNKLQINDNSPLVGRVGVRAFARMTSPERQTNKQTESVEVEIKSEPMDLEDEERQVEKMDLLKQFSLRPVNPQNAGLREVRVNKVVVAPLTRKTVSKPPDVRIKAKKTFPQPRKIDEGRSELNGKNSMVYIPIQPPTTQAPARTTRTITINGTNTQTVRPQSTNTTIANNAVNTISTPLVSVNTSVQPSCTIVTSTTSSIAVNQTPIIGQVAQLGQTIGPLSNVGPTIAPLSNVGQTIGPLSNVGQTIGPLSNVGQTSNFGPVTVTSMSNVAQLPTIGQMNAINQVATNVHTVPLITSVNGQWTFSLQPIMSVGGLDENSPLVNGISDRSTSLTPMVSLPTVQPLPVPALNTICSNPDNPGEPPRLQQKPLLNPLDPGVSIGAAPPPSSAGPLTAKLNQNAVKLTDFFRTLLEDTLDKVDEPAAQATLLKMQVEHTQWRHLQEIRELKHNHELTIMEMRASYEKEKARAVSEARRTAQAELEAAVKATKAKQWCANCSQEAQFYCCWNTSYCDYPCQKTHWNTHYATCAQQRNTTNNCENGNTIERLQPPDNLPVSGPTPTLTVGTKLTPSRVFSQDSQPPKTSIIVSMMEDHSGNQTMKCVGTYKPPSSSQVSPLIINKQIMNNEENSKKVVTSGGYLIVGAGTPPRRTHTIQYYT